MGQRHTDEEITLNLDSVLVVDDDEVSRNMIANFLTRLGVPNVEQAEDGDQAWELVNGRTMYDMIVLDWKLPGVSGLTLFNRIRQVRRYQTTPLLVVSGLLERNDFRLLQEFPSSALLEKPFTMAKFEAAATELWKESSWYLQNSALIDTLLEAVNGDGRKAEQLLKQVLKQAPNPLPLALLAAKRLVSAKLLKSAKAVLEALLKIDENSLLAMNEYGKVMHMLGNHKEALAVLRRASKMSPQNIQRLCLMGEVEMNLNDPEAAQADFAKALAIDDDNETAKAGMVVATNLATWLESQTPATQVPRSFASMLNTLGISLVRSGDFTKGIEQYRSALAFLHAPDDSARVAFNLGLGFLRWGKPAEALPWFRKAEALAPEGFGKAAGYVKQLVLSGAGVKGEHLLEADFAKNAPPAPTAPEAPAAERAPELEPGTLSADVDDAGGTVIPFPQQPNDFGLGIGKAADAKAKDKAAKTAKPEEEPMAKTGTTGRSTLSPEFLDFGEDDLTMGDEEEQAVL